MTNGQEIIRVKSIDISNFRGIRRLSRPLNTDADVVLITGPNGFGKTSLIDALSLVLTGYMHPRRVPVLFTLEEPVGNDSSQEGIIEAVLETAQGEQREVEVSLGKNNPPVCSDLIWPKSESAREITAKASFFYQDIVEQSFDSFTEGTTLKDFLAPPPQEISQGRAAIKEALNMVKKKEEALALPGVESEAALKEKREQVACRFAELWERLIVVVQDLKVQINLHLPIIVFFKKDRGRGLRQDWVNKLAGFTLELSEALGLETGGEDANALSSLRCVYSHVDELRLKYLIPKSEITERLMSLIASLPDPKRILELGMLSQLEEKCLSLKDNLAKSAKRLEQLSKLANHFKSPEGPSLQEIMHSLRLYGPKWSKINNTQAYESDLCPPQEVAEWAAGAYSSLNADNKQVDEMLTIWQEKVASRRSELMVHIAAQEKELAEHTKEVKILAEIQNIAETSTKGRKLVEEAQKKAGQDSSSGDQDINIEFLNNDSGQGANSLKLVDDIKNSLEEWIHIEERDIQRQNVLEKSAKYKGAIEQILLLKDALKRERDKKQSILENALQLPDSEPQKLADLINSILPRFRLVQGILPVHIKTSEKGTRNNKKGTWEFVTADGRTFTSLSTGQQSQLALALILGLNISLDISYLGHGIIALDDTTTSFDMSQLPREAALLRQIAYGAGEEESDKLKRQLFIASHHEDLTHRLIDFLIPPEGKKMHILDFVDWSPENGPTIEQYEMEPAKSAQNGRQDLAAFLNKVRGQA